MDLRRRERGQIIVVFVLAVVAIIAMVGLVLDGGSAYAQRREEQNVADLAAVAGATAHLNTTGDDATKAAAAVAAAKALAVDNGYTDGAGGVSIAVDVDDLGGYVAVTVDLTKPHRNNFAAIMGMPTWPVSVTATAESTGSPNAAVGAMPLLFNSEAFPSATCNEKKENCGAKIKTFQLPGTGNEDVPQDATQFNWTIFCNATGNPCNANSNGVRAIVEGGGVDHPIDLGMDIGPLNAGSHTTLFTAISAHIGGVFPVPIVTDEGNMVGFAYFKLLAVEGGSDKVIKGYFVSPVNAKQLIVSPGKPGATLETGAYSIKLTN